jgi:carbon-monoxide dehydrogenase large subunit
LISASTGPRGTINPLGGRGWGETEGLQPTGLSRGAIAAFPAIANAVTDASPPLGVTDFTGPTTQAGIWRAIGA